MVKTLAHRLGGWRRRAYEILEPSGADDLAARLVGRALVFLVAVNILAVILQSVPSLEAQYGILFEAIEWASLGIFTGEYLLRLWAAEEHAPYHTARRRRARFAYALSGAGMVDLLSVLPFWLALVAPIDLRAILIFRIVRFLKLTRYSPGMRSLLDAVYGERRALLGCLVILLGATLVSASIMHLVEQHAQPDQFGTIPDAMWWAIVTLATIGYGDVVPVTPLGKLVAACTIVMGLMMIALPVGIISSAFSNEIHRRDFVVTWSMVARVPLFSGLPAGAIADIMRLLRAQQYEPGAVIVRRGEAAHSMYLIASGEVDIDFREKSVRLAAGQFFGEVAVLKRARRTATVTARTRVNLLVLEAQDLEALMAREPQVAERLDEEMRTRLGHERIAPQGDLVVEEIEGGAAMKPKRD